MVYTGHQDENSGWNPVIWDEGTLPETKEEKWQSSNSKLNQPGSPPPYTLSSSPPPPSYKAMSSRSSSPTPISTPPSEPDPELGDTQHGQASSQHAHQPFDSPDSPKKRRGCFNRKVAWILGIFILLGIIITIVSTCIVFIPRRGREDMNTEAAPVVEPQPQPQPEWILVSEPQPQPEPEPEPEPEPVVEEPDPEPVQESAPAPAPEQVPASVSYPVYIQTCTHIPLLGWVLSWLESSIC